MFERLRHRAAVRRSRDELSRFGAERLRDIGLNPDDFRDAFADRHVSILFTPFRLPK